MKKLVILGSTGSIGSNSLKIISSFRERFQVCALAAGRNVRLLKKQIDTFCPQAVSVADESAARRLRALLGLNGPHSLKGRNRPQIFTGNEGLKEVAQWPGAEQVLSAVSGSAGLMPTMAALEAGKNVALANKETLVMAGPLVIAAARRKGVELFPIDSEHSAIFQALEGRRKDHVKKVLLTASGGPFLRTPKRNLRRVTPAQAVDHPRWKMGEKISVDSATMMNKGLEIIEASWLFGLPSSRIDILVHPEAVVHSLVEFTDGSLFAQMGVPDMRCPIAYALFHPERVDVGLRPLNLYDIGHLTFQRPDAKKFPALRLAREALNAGGTMPAVMSAADEVAVEAFLARRIRFTEISRIVEKVMSSHSVSPLTCIEDVMDASRWGKEKAWMLLQ